MDKKDIGKIVESFFEKLCIDIDSLEVIQEEENIFYVKIQTPNSSLLIGYSGKTLEDIRVILKNILRSTAETSENIVIHIEVNDYLIKKDEKLFDFVRKKVEIVQKTWQEVILPFFSAYERKKIHSFILSLKNDGITSKSSGEWKQRRICISKKVNHLTSIDLDAIDI